MQRTEEFFVISKLQEKQADKSVVTPNIRSIDLKIITNLAYRRYFRSGII